MHCFNQHLNNLGMLKYLSILISLLQVLGNAHSILQLNITVSDHIHVTDCDIVKYKNFSLINICVSSEEGSNLLHYTKYNSSAVIPELEHIVFDDNSNFLRGRNLAVTQRGYKHVNKLEPISRYKRRNVQNTSLYINWHWDIGNENGMLNIPRDERKSSDPYKLIVDVGLDAGSNLLCEIHKDPSIVYIGFEANLINFGVSHRAMLGKVNLKDIVRKRILLLPLGMN